MKNKIKQDFLKLANDCYAIIYVGIYESGFEDSTFKLIKQFYFCGLQFNKDIFNYTSNHYSTDFAKIKNEIKRLTEERPKNYRQAVKLLQRILKTPIGLTPHTLPFIDDAEYNAPVLSNKSYNSKLAQLSIEKDVYDINEDIHRTYYSFYDKKLTDKFVKKHY